MLYDKFIQDCGLAKFTFTLDAPRKVGMKYVFKFGKYKGMRLFDVLIKDKDYIKFLYESNQISFTKKDEANLKGIIYGCGQIIS